MNELDCCLKIAALRTLVMEASEIEAGRYHTQLVRANELVQEIASMPGLSHGVLTQLAQVRRSIRELYHRTGFNHWAQCIAVNDLDLLLEICKPDYSNSMSEPALAT